MDYSKINNYLGTLKIDEEAEYNQKRNKIMTRDFEFFKNGNPTSRNQNINFSKKQEPTDIKNDINNRLNNRELIPGNSRLNLHGRQQPIMDYFPKSSKN